MGPHWSQEEWGKLAGQQIDAARLSGGGRAQTSGHKWQRVDSVERSARPTAGLLAIDEAGRNIPKKGGASEERRDDKFGACAKTEANRCVSSPVEYGKFFTAGMKRRR